MFGIGGQELLIILTIAFFLFGAKKLPEIGRGLGQGIKNFKNGINELEDVSKEIKNATKGKIK